MTQLALSIPQSGQLNSTEDVKVASDLTAIQNVVNGNLDSANIATGGVAPGNLAVSAKQLFPQLVSAVTRKINFGTATLTFPGASATTNTLNQAHGLGTTPVAWVAMPASLGALVACVVYEPTASDATNLHIAASTVNGSTPTVATQLVVYWVAIG